MSTPANAHPTCEALPIKQEEFETLRAPSLIPSSIIVGNLPHKYEPQPSSTLTPVATTYQQLIMATLYKMPIRGTNKVPKFNRTTENLVDFIDIYEGHANEAGLCGLDCIKGIIRYLPPSEQELWGGLPEVTLSNYEAFIKEVKVMYPGCEGPKYYMLNDFQAVMCNHASKLMPLAKELSDYLCMFRRIMQPLKNEDRIGKSECDCIFFQGIPGDVQMQIRTCLLIKFPDHHPREPHLYMNVFEAGQFLLPATAASAATQVSAPATDLMSLVVTPPSAQQPAQGSVMKCEYQYKRGNAPLQDDCVFCSSLKHFLG
ncbi:uncharacterized protein BJ212DRAFT_1297039 [Suillus subaureus]|uniref:Uncharacterized protein n=1 Tax=Suillus subaureus TaxID=48587 RepID=A0A9P7EH79_9AGAM|nr:uncharacterized protein BJ212DRAFT_1297039 [Suillus subaureus]KAG1821700.1 hypothetical protein BJ212DRAFT_1297039 [Suillus subaureus]